MRQIQTLDQVPTDGTALLYIGTGWCTWCARTVAAIGEVAPSLNDLGLLKIDGDDEPDILTAVSAKTYPQLLLFRDGALVAQRESADAATLTAWLAEHGVK